jgi:hypothetical protein
MTVRNVVGANGFTYRGPLSCPSATTPWKITYSPFKGAWKTAEKFAFADDANRYLDKIASAAADAKTPEAKS